MLQGRTQWQLQQTTVTEAGAHQQQEQMEQQQQQQQQHQQQQQQQQQQKQQQQRQQRQQQQDQQKYKQKLQLRQLRELLDRHSTLSSRTFSDAAATKVAVRAGAVTAVDERFIRVSTQFSDTPSEQLERTLRHAATHLHHSSDNSTSSINPAAATTTTRTTTNKLPHPSLTFSPLSYSSSSSASSSSPLYSLFIAGPVISISLVLAIALILVLLLTLCSRSTSQRRQSRSRQVSRGSAGSGSSVRGTVSRSDDVTCVTEVLDPLEQSSSPQGALLLGREQHLKRVLLDLCTDDDDDEEIAKKRLVQSGREPVSKYRSASSEKNITWCGGKYGSALSSGVYVPPYGEGTIYSFHPTTVQRVQYTSLRRSLSTDSTPSSPADHQTGTVQFTYGPDATVCDVIKRNTLVRCEQPAAQEARRQFQRDRESLATDCGEVVNIGQEKRSSCRRTQKLVAQSEFDEINDQPQYYSSSDQRGAVIGNKSGFSKKSDNQRNIDITRNDIIDQDHIVGGWSDALIGHKRSHKFLCQENSAGFGGFEERREEETSPLAAAGEQSRLLAPSHVNSVGWTDWRPGLKVACQEITASLTTAFQLWNVTSQRESYETASQQNNRDDQLVLCGHGYETAGNTAVVPNSQSSDARRPLKSDGRADTKESEGAAPRSSCREERRTFARRSRDEIESGAVRYLEEREVHRKSQRLANRTRRNSGSNVDVDVVHPPHTDSTSAACRSAERPGNRRQPIATSTTSNPGDPNLIDCRTDCTGTAVAQRNSLRYQDGADVDRNTNGFNHQTAVRCLIAVDMGATTSSSQPSSLSSSCGCAGGGGKGVTPSVGEGEVGWEEKGNSRGTPGKGGGGGFGVGEGGVKRTEDRGEEGRRLGTDDGMRTRGDDLKGLEAVLSTGSNSIISSDNPSKVAVRSSDEAVAVVGDGFIEKMSLAKRNSVTIVGSVGRVGVWPDTGKGSGLPGGAGGRRGSTPFYPVHRGSISSASNGCSGGEADILSASASGGCGGVGEGTRRSRTSCSSASDALTQMSAGLGGYGSGISSLANAIGLGGLLSGSRSGQGSGSSGGLGSPREESFWVPPAILQKKRAQSLIPQLVGMGGYGGGIGGAGGAGGGGAAAWTRNNDKNGGAAFSRHHNGSSPQSSTDSLSGPSGFPASPGLVLTSLPLPEALTALIPVTDGGGGGGGGGGVGGGMGGGNLRRRRASMQDALDFTKIDASLYETPMPQPVPRCSDFASIQEENLGFLNFSLKYDPDQSLLTVYLIQARELVARDFSGTADPFCRLCLLPDTRNQLQSRVHKRTLSPEFEEGFIFEVSSTELSERAVEVLLYDYDQFSHDECVGQLHIPLDQFLLTSTPSPSSSIYTTSVENGTTGLSSSSNYWRPFAPYEKKPEDLLYFGDLMFSLAYLSTAERLTVAVIKAKKLRPIGEDGKCTANPYVRVSLIGSDGKRRKRKKTSTKRNSLNPVWNEALVFNITRDRLLGGTTTGVEFTIFNDNLLGNNEPLGEVVVGRGTAGEELAHWNDMLNLKNAMARWHRLHLTTSGAASNS